MSQKVKKLVGFVFLLIITWILPSCKKYLDAKPDKVLVVPSTLQDLQAIIDYSPNMIIDPGSDEVSADNYYLTTADWSALTEGQRRIYIWEKDKIFDQYSNDWSDAYKKVFYINTVFDNLDAAGKKTNDPATEQSIRGQALFLRAKAFLQIAGIWSLAYDPGTSSSDFGIPLRLHADFTETSVRSTVKQTYERIINDFKESIPLLPLKPLHVTRASRPASYAFLARTYLYMRKYPEALAYADSCLQLKNTLLDYNAVIVSAAFPIQQFNEETIFYSITGQVHLSPNRCKIDSNLYKSYDSSDIRKAVFFQNNGNKTFAFKGSYSGFDGRFTGMAVDEVYLMRAECNARAGNTAAALSDLNTLLQKRFIKGTFIPVTALNSMDALTKILLERRKELLMRCVRWMDIKRLNKENAGITLTRIVNNQMYTLPPNDLRYALPLPEEVLSRSGMLQNPR